MKNVPDTAVKGGIFHIFIPGLFLFINLVADVYFFPGTNEGIRKFVDAIIEKPTIYLAVTIGFGYLVGVILRMFRCGGPDYVHGKLLGMFNKFSDQRFPYVAWIGEAIKDLPEDVQNYYKEVWAGKNSLPFFNFCKMIIISRDEKASNEIVAAESICRYSSSMFYALLVASGFIIILLVAEWLTGHQISAAFAGLLVGYIFAIFCILINYRDIRRKEVFIVFAAAYKNRVLY
ncbi:MAG: hypothetical protein HQK59_14325 [Deltaproteobacteria bacterium]|nr:hypothetical protein [Deltaproteobacteria bacterium]